MRRILTFWIVLLWLCPAWAQKAPVEVRQQVSSRSLKLGQSLRLTVDVRVDPGAQFKPPAADSFEFPLWEVRDAVLTRLPPQGGRQRVRYTFNLASYETGNQEVPSLKLSYTFAGHTREAASQAVSVNVVAPSVGEKDDIRDFHALDALPVPAWVWLVLAVSAALTLVLFRLGWRSLSQSLRKKPAPPLPPAEWALGQLKVLNVTEPEQYQRMSHVLRSYLARRYDVPVLERTTAEVVSSLRDSALPEEHLPTVMSVLQDSDLVKFARQIPDPVTAQLQLEGTCQLIESTRETPKDA